MLLFMLKSAVQNKTRKQQKLWSPGLQNMCATREMPSEMNLILFNMKRYS